jgi:hypothetical protein
VAVAPRRRVRLSAAGSFEESSAARFNTGNLARASMSLSAIKSRYPSRRSRAPQWRTASELTVDFEAGRWSTASTSLARSAGACLRDNDPQERALGVPSRRDPARHTAHYPMLEHNLVYNGVTRGKRAVVLVGQRKALPIAVKGARTRRRWSKLRE